MKNFELKRNIVFENNDLLIINKLAGIVVHPDKKYKDNTLADYVVQEYPEIKNVGQSGRPGIVHRLDKDTSGLIIVAKNQKTFDYLKDLFKERKIEKRYYALVYGIMKEKSGIITYSLEKRGKVRAKLSSTSRPAVTRYKVIKEYGEEFTLLDVTIETGRTHQIRVHLTKIGHPIVGDKMYKFKRVRQADLNRQFLHAYFLKFRLPSGQTHEFRTKLPEDLKEFLHELKQI